MAETICVRKKTLNALGYRDLPHWLEDPNHVYIGRDVEFYVAGARGSKWRNKFTEKKYGRARCLELYRDYVLNDGTRYGVDGKTLLESLEELRGKTLGCWCKPDRCHGDVLVELLTERSCLFN